MNAMGRAETIIRVMLVDDHPIVRQGLAAMVDDEPDMSTVAQAPDGRTAVALYREHRPDVTVMDFQMPDMDGAAATIAIRSEWPEARIVMLTTYVGDVQALRAFKAGVTGYLLKSAVLTSLADAIRTAHLGQRYIPTEVAKTLAAHVMDDALSVSEIEVLIRVAQGKSNREIAAQLFLSDETVKSHMKHLMSKLGASDRTHAVTIALKRGIFEL